MGRDDLIEKLWRALKVEMHDPEAESNQPPPMPSELRAALTAAGLEVNKAGTREALKIFGDIARKKKLNDPEEDFMLIPIEAYIANLRAAATLTEGGG